MGIRYSKQRQVPTAPAPKYNPSIPLQSNYSIALLAEQIEHLTGEITNIRLLMIDLLKQNAEMKLELLAEGDTDYFTIEDVSRFFDISARLQQQDRTDKKLGYLKKKDGSKILYSKEHIKVYLANEFEEHRATIKSKRRVVRKGRD